jgi:hypothetical protein|tara:strand:- start:477 stop:650 length:174 start_codon:yes stop_codon:yes gene_type:complete
MVAASPVPLATAIVPYRAGEVPACVVMRRNGEWLFTDLQEWMMAIVEENEKGTHGML